MKRKIWGFGLIFLLFFFCLLWAEPVFAGEQEENSEEAYLEEVFDQVDFSELDIFMEEDGIEQMTFSELVHQFMQGGINRESLSDVALWVKSLLFQEITQNKQMLLEIVLLAVCFSILKNFAGAFQSSYTADLCFLLIYCVLAVMLLTSFRSFQEIISGALERSVEFMKALIPTLCISMVFSSNISSSASFYQIAFFIIYLVEWSFLNILLPMVHIYVLLEIFNHFMTEERFLNLTELVRDMIGWGMKAAGTAVLGLNVVQNLISPAKDRLTQGTLGRATAVIPGVGGAVNSVGEIVLGAGMVIKNCVGVAGLVVLLVIGMIPLLKVLCIAFFYKLAAAVTEPVTDKRIAGCLKGMSEGAVLYVKLLGYSLVMFLLTIALTTASTSYIY